MRIAPSILSADLTRLGEQIAACHDAGADWIHIDVMDGHFVPNITFGPVIVEAARRATSLPLDVHLMIASPERHLDAFAQAGADILTVHVEACPHLHRTLGQIRDLGKLAGVALNPGTPAGAVSDVIGQADLLLAMTVNPGFSGQRFIESVLGKVRQLRLMAGPAMAIEVDGGIDPVTAPLAAAAGADILVAASAVFAGGLPIAQAIAQLRQSVATTPASAD
jgi:ribulose-phosphate 3-epimerase